MKASLAALLAGLLAVSAYPSKNDLFHDYSDEWQLVPDINWHMHLVSEREIAYDQAKAAKATFNVDFILFTRANPLAGEEIATGDVDALRRSQFNPRIPTRFITHGWTGSRESQENAWIRDKYLALGEFNVFVVDWKGGADTWNYIAAAQNTMHAGKLLAAFVDFLNLEGGLSFNDVYLIGHSLGSHVVGIAGKHVTRGKINTIYGLDPALPLFFIDKPEKRLAVGDALYVESIHTNAGVLGFDKPIGDASFYPNWGIDQPGCSGSDLTGGCSHARSCQYFAESLDRVDLFVAEQCKDYKDIESKNCQSTGKTARMGGNPSNQGQSVTGEFYLPTNSKQPFGKGASWLSS